MNPSPKHGMEYKKKCAQTKFAQKPIKSTTTNLWVPKSQQIIKSDLKHTSWDYIPSMK